MGKSLTKVTYQPDTQSTAHYVAIVNPEEYKKWKEGDTTIPLAEVVDSFQIFYTNQGAQGILGQPSKQQLESDFGSHNDVEVMEQVLKKGSAQASDGISNNAWSSKNDTHGSLVDTKGGHRTTGV